MMSREVFWLVVIVSCAHAMVHVYEFSLPSVEQLIAVDYGVGKQVTGWMATAWRVPFGFGALLAGWLVDRFGAERMLAIYLFGCAGMAGLMGLSPSLPYLFVVLLAMGAFASIYHPAGLALISLNTNALNRPRALGLHGIFGSGGIGFAPFLAGIVLTVIPSWRAYYGLLIVPGLTLGMHFLYLSVKRRDPTQTKWSPSDTHALDEDRSDWPSYLALTVLAMMMGFTYTAVLSFLPRYMDGAGIQWGTIRAEGMRNYLAGGVLFAGCVGQYLAGRLARPDRLEGQLAGVMFATAPFLLWMSIASGWYRLVATGLFALIHFMHQPLYNSLVAKYASRQRRSLAYGFSFAVGLGLGGAGAVFAGYSTSDFQLHATLAVVAITAGIWATLLRRRNGCFYTKVRTGT